LIWTVVLLFIPTNPFKALGGIQIAGGSERVKVGKTQLMAVREMALPWELHWRSF
jgi:hypothetical protein